MTRIVERLLGRPAALWRRRRDRARTDREFDAWLAAADDAHTAAVVGDLDVDAALAAVRRRVADEPAAPVDPDRPSLPVAGVGADGRTGREQLAALGRVVGLIAVGAVLALLGPPALAVVYTYLVAPGLVVVWWFRESGALHRWAVRRRPYGPLEWALQLTSRGRTLAGLVERLRALRRRLRRLREDVAALRALPAAGATPDVAERLDDLDRQLAAARRDAKSLVKLLAVGSADAEDFARRALRDPSGASLRVDRLFTDVDPERVGNLARSVVLALKLAGDRAGALPLLLDGRAQRRAVRLATGLSGAFVEGQRSSRAVRRACKRTLRDANGLHAAITAQVVGRLALGRVTTAAALAALRISPLLRRPAKRAVVRTVFVRELPGGPTRGRARIAAASAAAISRGWTWSEASPEPVHHDEPEREGTS